MYTLRRFILSARPSQSPCPQANIAPAAAQLGKGQLSVEAWQQQFSLDSIRDLAVAAQL
jgi:hypothetical protein